MESELPPARGRHIRLWFCSERRYRAASIQEGKKITPHWDFSSTLNELCAGGREGPLMSSTCSHVIDMAFCPISQGTGLSEVAPNERIAYAKKVPSNLAKSLPQGLTLISQLPLKPTKTQTLVRTRPQKGNHGHQTWIATALQLQLHRRLASAGAFGCRRGGVPEIGFLGSCQSGSPANECASVPVRRELEPLGT